MTAKINGAGTARRALPRTVGMTPARAMSRDAFSETFNRVIDNVERVIKGKSDQIRMVLIALLADGHVLLEDMPGTGKTMLARAIAQSLNATSNRVQCTPDLLPSDITGSPIFDQVTHSFSFREGPVFSNILLVDEINRATPKTQSALLEAMQERRVSVDGTTYRLPKPFLVIATQNPIELAGTFPLPEAQLDRFLLKLSLGYADHDAEVSILRNNSKSEVIDSLTSVIDSEDVLAMMEWATGVTVHPEIENYIVGLAQQTRTDPSLLMGASSRASLSLLRASRVLAASQGREDVLPDDVKALVVPVFGHRLVLTPDAGLREETIDNVIDRIVNRVKLPLGITAA